jgi:hypothetical protein
MKDNETDEPGIPVDHSGPYPYRIKNLSRIEKARRNNYIAEEDGEHYHLHHLVEGDPRNEATIAAHADKGVRLGFWAEGETAATRAAADRKNEQDVKDILARTAKLDADAQAEQKREAERRKTETDEPRWR